MREIFVGQFLEVWADIWRNLKPVQLDLNKNTEFYPSCIHQPEQGGFKDDNWKVPNLSKLVFKMVKSLNFKVKSLNWRQEAFDLYMARARTERPTLTKRRERAPNKTGWKWTWKKLVGIESGTKLVGIEPGKNWLVVNLETKKNCQQC